MPPDTDSRELVHHYTDAAGLLGIIEGGRIWCTDYRFLNDSQEFAVAQKLYKNALTIENGIDPKVAELAQNAIEMLAHEPMEVEGFPISFYRSFVASFSIRDDDLSQWRGYAGRGARYSIGFRRQVLERHLGEDGFESGLVSYAEDDARRRLASSFNRVAIPFLQEHLRPDNPMGWTQAWEIHKPHVGSLNVEALLPAAPFCKHQAFKDEEEWRIVYRRTPSMTGANAPKVHFRPGRSLIIPYIELKFDESAIAQIRVGPSPMQAESIESVRQLAPRVNVVESSIPYRDW